MPRTKTTRNFTGTILTREKIIHGKKRVVYIARKRYAVTDTDGDFILDKNGKKVYKDKTEQHLSLSAAQAALANLPDKIRADKENKKTVKKESHSLFDLADYFKREYCQPAVIVGNRQISGYRQNPKNIEKYVEDYKAFFGDVALSDLTYEHIRAFAVHLATTKVKLGNKLKLPEASTVNRKLSYLRRLLNVGVRLRWIAVNPFKEGETLIHPNLETARTRILTFEEEAQIFAHFEREKITIETTRYDKPLKMTISNPHRHLKLIVMTAIDTGMRMSEIFALKRGDVDLTANIIHLPARHTKALKERFIPISERLNAELEKYFAANNLTAKDLIGGGKRDCTKAFDTMCDYLGIEGVTFHSLRHTATTWMDEAGISQGAKKNIVGHSSDAVHQRYTNQSVNTFDTVRRKMEDFRRARESVEEERKAA